MDLAMHDIHKLADNPEANAEAAVLAPGHGGLEGIEDASLVFFRDADAVVLYRQPYLGAVAQQRDLDCFARAIFVGMKRTVPCAPETAVRYDANGASMMVVGADNRVSQVPVRTGDHAGEIHARLRCGLISVISDHAVSRTIGALGELVSHCWPFPDSPLVPRVARR